jgi:CheY-like chemotaxis protein
MSEGHKLLVVEDEPMLRELVAKRLAERGYAVSVAPNGREALNMVGERGDEFETILLDLLMPVMDGYHFLEVFRKLPGFASTPVIVMSNSGLPQDLNRAYKLGACDVLIKAEFTPDLLVRKVGEVIAQTIKK